MVSCLNFLVSLKYLLHFPILSIIVGSNLIAIRNVDAFEYPYINADEDDFCYDIFNKDQCLYLQHISKIVANKFEQQNEDSRINFNEEYLLGKNHLIEKTRNWTGDKFLQMDREWKSNLEHEKFALVNEMLQMKREVTLLKKQLKHVGIIESNKKDAETHDKTHHLNRLLNHINSLGSLNYDENELGTLKNLEKYGFSNLSIVSVQIS